MRGPLNNPHPLPGDRNLYTTEEVAKFILESVRAWSVLKKKMITLEEAEGDVFTLYPRHTEDLSLQDQYHLRVVYNDAACRVDAHDHILEQEILKVTARVTEEREEARRIMKETAATLGYHPDPM